MKSLKITTLKGGEITPEVTISIPIKVLEIANKLMPRKASALLNEQGIDLSNISELLKFEEDPGVLLEIDDHKKNEKTVISIE